MVAGHLPLFSAGDRFSHVLGAGALYGGGNGWESLSRIRGSSVRRGCVGNRISLEPVYRRGLALGYDLATQVVAGGIIVALPLSTPTGSSFGTWTLPIWPRRRRRLHLMRC